MSGIPLLPSEARAYTVSPAGQITSIDDGFYRNPDGVYRVLKESSERYMELRDTLADSVLVFSTVKPPTHSQASDDPTKITLTADGSRAHIECMISNEETHWIGRPSALKAFQDKFQPRERIAAESGMKDDGIPSQFSKNSIHAGKPEQDREDSPVDPPHQGRQNAHEEDNARPLNHSAPSTSLDGACPRLTHPHEGISKDTVRGHTKTAAATLLSIQEPWCVRDEDDECEKEPFWNSDSTE